MPLINIPESLLTRDKAIDPATRWPARIPTEGRRVDEVIGDLNRRFRALSENDDLHFYDFHVMHNVRHQPHWPYGAWIGCFPVKGSNEGYYVHVHAICRDGTNQLLALCKVENENPELAARIAVAAFYLLEA